jgi:hypothetical protein
LPCGHRELLSDEWSEVFVVLRNVFIHALPDVVISTDLVTQLEEDTVFFQ